MKTSHIRAQDVEDRWYIYDASQHTLGRMASHIAVRLMGKDRPTYTPSELLGAHVVVINAGKVRVTGQKEEQKTSVELIARRSYKGEFLRSRKRGSTGFKAPEWYGFAWANLEKDEEPPDRANTKDKVVVIHAFQSW